MGFFPIGTGNAVPSDVLTGTSFSSGTLPAGATGNIPDQGSPTITPSGNNAIALSAGYYTGGSVSQVSVPASQVLTGTTIAGVAGTMPNRGAPTWTPTTSNQALSAGYYTGGTVQGDSNLVTGNIRSGVSIFGIAGDSNVVDTSSATAVAANIFTGYTAFVAGSKITGTMPNATLSSPMVPGTTNQGIPAGYHAGNGNDYVEGDANLAAGNIKSGVGIFGVSGNVIQASGDAGAAQVLSGYSASNSGGGFSGSMPNRGGLTLPGTTTSTTTFPSGYYSGIAFSVPGWATLTSDSKSRDSVGAAYDSSANLTYAIDGWSGGYLTTVTAYSRASNSWATLANDIYPRQTPGVAYDSSANLTYSIEGYGGSFTQYATAYSHASNAWTAVANEPVGTGRVALAAAYDSSANLTYAIDGSGVSYIATVTAYSHASNAWTTEANDTTAREYLGAAYDSSANLTYAIDGYNGGYLSTVTAYSHASNAWTTEANDTTARERLGAAYDSSANLTYAIDGDTSTSPNNGTAIVTAYSR